MNILREWYNRYSSDPQVVILALLLVAGFVAMVTLGEMLVPVLVGVIIAYLLDGLVEKSRQLGAPRLSAVALVFILFLTFLVFAILWLMPRLWAQLTQLVAQLPVIIGSGQELLLQLPVKYPNLFSEQQVTDLIAAIRGEITALGQQVLSLSIASVFGLITLIGCGDVRDVLADGPAVCIAAGDGGRTIRDHPLYRRGRGHGAGGDNRLVPVGLDRGFWLAVVCLWCDPGAGWLPAGAIAVLGSRRPASCGNHYCHTGLRWIVGILGRVLCHSAGDPGTGRNQGMADEIPGRVG
jgi:hypothetical protein